MEFVKFEDRKKYRINEIGILCDYEPILIDEEKSATDWGAIQIGDNWYSDPYYLKDLYDFYENTPEDGPGGWWEYPYYYDKNCVVVLSTVDTNIYMFDTRHGNDVFRKPNT